MVTVRLKNLVDYFVSSILIFIPIFDGHGLHIDVTRHAARHVTHRLSG